ncbi:MAG: GNAT family N-acetyltransferase [Armatimonadetes bacterium]|nr:GNAT family N-acetyltransferase [Armatimonadota bacterium]
MRRAGREDATDLLNLICALAEFEKLAPPDADAQHRLIEHGLGASPRYEAWLALKDGRSVGYAIVFETYSTFLARPTLYLEDIFVLPEARGLGIGSALFDHVRALAIARGCGRMEWCCLDWNVDAQAFYERAGARNLSEWLYYRLDGQALASTAEGELDAA